MTSNDAWLESELLSGFLWMKKICYTPIGLIRSTYQEPAGMPIQAVAAKGVAGSIKINWASVTDHRPSSNHRKGVGNSVGYGIGVYFIWW